MLIHFSEHLRQQNTSSIAIFIQLGFLLMDNLAEAHEYTRGITATYYKQPSLSLIRCLLLYGRQKRVKNWDLKVISALYLIVKNITQCHCLISAEVCEIQADMANLGLSTAASNTNQEELINDYLVWCKKLDDKEQCFLSNFRLQFYWIFNNLSPNEAADFLDAAFLSFCERSMSLQHRSSITTGELHPMTILLQMLCDGNGFDDISLKNLRLILPTDIVNKVRIFLDRISPEDIAIGDKSAFAGNISPFIGGTAVSKGECLIINQAFKNNPKKFRAGTHKDVASLKDAMMKIGCQDRIYVEEDLDTNGVFSAITKFRSRLEYSSPDFIVVVILSHGRRNPSSGSDEIMDINMKGIPMSKIKNMFINGEKCPIMIGKPKLFFIQACRGPKEQAELSGEARYFH